MRQIHRTNYINFLTNPGACAAASGNFACARAEPPDTPQAQKQKISLLL